VTFINVQIKLCWNKFIVNTQIQTSAKHKAMEITKHKLFYSCRHLKCSENEQECLFTIRLTMANILELTTSADFFLGLVVVATAAAAMVVTIVT
jgi:hypothetical protein